MSNLLQNFHKLLKKEFSKKYHKEVFDEMFEPKFNLENGYHVTGSGIKYELNSDLHMNMIILLLNFAKKNQIFFTISHIEPVELTWFIGSGNKFLSD